MVNSRQRLLVVSDSARTSLTPFQDTSMKDGENDDTEKRSQYPDNRHYFGDQGQPDHHQGYATQGELGIPQAAMPAFEKGLGELARFEPPNIFSSWIVARFRDRILHEANRRADPPG
jgi:hypothetical protein